MQLSKFSACESAGSANWRGSAFNYVVTLAFLCFITLRLSREGSRKKPGLDHYIRTQVRSHLDHRKRLVVPFPRPLPRVWERDRKELVYTLTVLRHIRITTTQKMVYFKQHFNYVVSSFYHAFMYACTIYVCIAQCHQTCSCALYV